MYKKGRRLFLEARRDRSEGRPSAMGDRSHEGRAEIGVPHTRLFATADGIVAENLVERFCRDVAIPEAKFFTVSSWLSKTSMRRRILCYSKASSLILRASGLTRCSDRGSDHSGQDALATRLAAFVAVEAFLLIEFRIYFFLKSQGKMNALGFSNELICRDEGIAHCVCVALIPAPAYNRPPMQVIHEMFKEAVEIEIQLCIQMSQYIRFSADQLLKTLGYEALYGDSNPHRQFEFMAMMSLPGRVNFFEKQNSDYRLPRMEVSDVRTGLWSEDAFCAGYSKENVGRRRSEIRSEDEGKSGSHPDTAFPIQSLFNQ
ncbi:ferritin-like superfamily [Ephemerocybe angulata]|uniref:Ferritin-like superfamily n=1 Tax=Ephemerocybe angulata TaxID=980116 RepID=A0A8H6H7U9_9AGAR|nr:ferritin-like superfamily [Tulosesus angulatus]